MVVCLPFELVALGIACIVGVAYIVLWAAYIWWQEGSWLAKRRRELADLWNRLRH